MLGIRREEVAGIRACEVLPGRPVRRMLQMEPFADWHFQRVECRNAEGLKDEKDPESEEKD